MRILVCTFEHVLVSELKFTVTLYFKVSVLQCNYTFKNCVIIIKKIYCWFNLKVTGLP